MKSGKTLSIVAMALGGVAILVGLSLVGAYILAAVVERRGEPDQSLLFWYLPLLFIGVISLISGVATSVWGFVRLRRSP